MPELQRILTEDPATAGRTGGQLALLTACDVSYLEYAIRLILSAEAFSPGQRIILHVVNPDARVLQRLAHLRSRLQHTTLQISHEIVALDGLTPEQRRAYYACVRFIRLAELMPVSPNDFLVLDADALVVSPIDGPIAMRDDAQLALVRRDLGPEPVPDHLAVAAGAVWFRSEPAVHAFATRLSADLIRQFQANEAEWFMDQRALVNRIRDPNAGLRVGPLDRRYADWTFSDEAVIWQGKGSRKLRDLRFVLLSELLSDDARQRVHAQPLARMLLSRRDRESADAVLSRIARLSHRAEPNLVILLPRIDLPWKKPAPGPLPTLADEVMELRVQWVRFVTLLAHASEAAGLSVEIVQLPLWEINRRLVDALGASLVLVPHHCSHDFEPGATPVLFYMQEYFSWMFVVDPKGWSAGASIYPVSIEPLPEARPAGAYDTYRARLNRGELSSKFSQPARQRARPRKRSTGRFPLRWGWDRLRRALPPALVRRAPPKIFFPLQIPHDQSIRYFSDQSLDAVVKAVVEWGAARRVAIHLKAHPANPKRMQAYRAQFPEGRWLKWREENIHDLIDECDAVFLVNSGVGFEALLHAKPIVMFGRAEYDCVAIRATIDEIDAAWAACQSSDPDLRARQYGQFFDWFTTEYAVDLSREDVRDRQLQRLVHEFLAIARGTSARTPAHALGGADA
jgi:hypothetical protein